MCAAHCCSQKKVAIIGLTPPDTATTSSPGSQVVISSIESTLPGCIADAKTAGATMIVLLTHVSEAGSPTQPPVMHRFTSVHCRQPS